MDKASRKGKSKGHDTGYPIKNPEGNRAVGKDKFKKSHNSTKMGKKGLSKFGKDT